MYRMFVRPDGALGRRGGEIMARHGIPMACRAIGHLAPKQTDKVIEIGFGPGVALEMLSIQVTEGHVTGVDPSETMHHVASDRNALAIREGRVMLVTRTSESMPFQDSSFDAGLAIDNLHFWPDRLAGLMEVKRVLRPQARFVCAFTPPSGGTGIGLPDLLTKAGFAEISVDDSADGICVTAIAGG